jgi:hypothetical protein
VGARPKDEALAVTGPTADGPQADEQQTLGLADERVLGEISHEMGNYFHKLYYWTEHLKSRAGTNPTDMAATEMLESTIGRLEHFMRMVLEYFAPARLCFNRVEASDLVSGLESCLPGRRLRVQVAESVAGMAVLADASLIGHALRTVFERVTATLIDEDEMLVVLTAASRREFAGVEIEFHAGAGVGSDRSLIGGIEMAVAEKFLQMHGGELFERDPESLRGLVVFLPIYE